MTDALPWSMSLSCSVGLGLRSGGRSAEVARGKLVQRFPAASVDSLKRRCHAHGIERAVPFHEWGGLVVGVATAFNRRTLERRLALLLLVVFLLLASSSTAAARQAASESRMVAPEPCPVTLHTEREREPNDEALEAQPLAGPVCVTGEILAADQDVFRWELDETAALERWTFVLSGLPGQAGVVRLYRPTFSPDGDTLTAVDEVIGAANH